MPCLEKFNLRDFTVYMVVYDAHFAVVVTRCIEVEGMEVMTGPLMTKQS